MAEAYPWQQALWQQLARRQQHAHAYLLHGPAGIGKRALAERLAALLLCAAPTAEGACGGCKACLLLRAGTHPDFFDLQPEEPDKPIKVDQVRELVDFVAQTAQLGGRKLVLLEPAEAMNLNAANALLKSLEEPSGDTVLLLVSHQPSRLLPTIRSRCLQQACPLPTPVLAGAWLAAQLPELEPALHRRLLALATGSPLRALQLHRDGVLDQRALVEEGIRKLLKQQAAPSELAEAWKHIPLALLLDWFCAWLLQVLRCQLAGAEGEAEEPMDKVVRWLAGRTPPNAVLALQDWLLAERQKVLGKANLNRALLLEALLVRWASLPSAG
ncbi:DNA polymerase III subunit delta' [Pseudomonas sp. OF001]|uniref:DNA polymerase III subunit delta' n=1 Tax=unclassified Pseudomonas TaxID=196821 RepID=UPI0010A66C1C|nr:MULTISPECIES: DNA polymerase III subunit delta' [unclassified Pseudomonas]THG84751.1 DNA polymerase III subunit delta' [Pseudomonas sp. A-1]WPP46019.1 DNA polymerase III subunit delta' [Pseudomonas sp. AN-1]CAD5377500.1 DNA polymerase III subunit delta' [Pseudomonas sp. OF001]